MITSILARKKQENKQQAANLQDGSKNSAKAATSRPPSVFAPAPKPPKPPTKAQAARAKLQEEREATQQEKTKPESKWRWEHSWAKEILRGAIANGDITDAHTYDEIHRWHPEVEATDRKLLSSRVRALQQQISVDKQAADEDNVDLLHDLKLFPTKTHNYRGEPRWEGSDAQKALKFDIANGIHLTMTPAEFASRKVFKDCAEDIVQQHTHQEVKFQKYCLCRNDKKESSRHKFSR